MPAYPQTFGRPRDWRDEIDDAVLAYGRNAAADLHPAVFEGLGGPVPPLQQVAARTQPDPLADLRRQQADFHRTLEGLDRQNSWMAIPALAPGAAVAGLEGGAALAARLAPRLLPEGPLNLVQKDPYLRVGDNWATRIGRRAHADFQARVEQKPGWDPEQNITTEAGIRRPDAQAPVRDPAFPDRRRFLELKPNTPTGRAAGARQVKSLEEQTKNRGRVVYYDPGRYK